MFRYPCPGVEAAREGGRCNVGVKGRRTCESDVKGRRSGESDPKGLRTPGKSGVDASCVAVLADCECVGSIIISIHVGERGGESAPDVTSMRNREGERRGFCEGAAMRRREGSSVAIARFCNACGQTSAAMTIAITRPVTIRYATVEGRAGGPGIAEKNQSSTIVEQYVPLHNAVTRG